MLEVENIHAAYGDHDVLHSVSLSLALGEFVAVVGPNGAGKSTLFKAISGLIPIKSGAIKLESQNLARVPAHRRAHLGIAHVPEGRQVFPSLTVRENLEIGG
jgi:branched-chain amino acid transport system ATP-binding protein